MENQDHQTALLRKMSADRTTVAVWLISGKRLIGRIKAFDRFTVVLEHAGADHLVFKHAIATVGPAREMSREPREPSRD